MAVPVIVVVCGLLAVVQLLLGLAASAWAVHLFCLDVRAKEGP